MESANKPVHFDVFSYDSYAYSHEENVLTFHFSYRAFKVKGQEETFSFHPTTQIYGVTKEMIESVGEQRLSRYAFILGLAEIPSYWKATLAKEIHVHANTMSETDVAFWEKLFLLGMGEFFYVNQIDPFSPKFVVTTATPTPLTRKQPLTTDAGPKTTILVPVGGGKDSIVSLEILANAGYEIYTTSGHLGSSEEIITVFSQHHDLSQDIVFERNLDPKLFELNRQGYPNGHTPFSSVLAPLTTCIADVFSIPYVAVSNEQSSNEATTTWKGIDVNHQYSKSFEFEQDFQKYIQTQFADAPLYFSLLRPLFEFQIIALFLQYPQYFEVFHSCNVGQKDDIWCGNCAKCAFVALLLSAFLPDEEIERIFRKDMLLDESLSFYWEQLLGIVETKPFECIGTRDESAAALYVAFRIRHEAGKPIPKLMHKFETYVKEREETLAKYALQILTSYNTTHSLPTEFDTLIRKQIPNTV